MTWDAQCALYFIDEPSKLQSHARGDESEILCQLSVIRYICNINIIILYSKWYKWNMAIDTCI